MYNNKNINLRIFHIKPLGCINCGHWDTEWIPVYKGSEITETILVCPQCSHNERLKQPAFKHLFKFWLEQKLAGKDFQNGLAKYIDKNKN